MSQSQNELLDARYGRKRNRRRDRVVAIVVAAVAVVGFGAWSVGYAVWQATAASATVLAYRVLADTQTSVDLQLTRAGGQAVECDVRALASDFGVVGFKTVVFAAGSEDSPTLSEVSINTTHRAVSADVKNCRLK